MTQQKNVLIMEDDRPILQAIQLKLEKKGFSVMAARSVSEAEEYLRQAPRIDAIWLDHWLVGKQTGLDFLSRCKKGTSLFKNIPVFVVSNTASPDKAKQYLKMGAKQFYVKAEKRLEDIVEDINSSIAKNSKKHGK